MANRTSIALLSRRIPALLLTPVLGLASCSGGGSSQSYEDCENACDLQTVFQSQYEQCLVDNCQGLSVELADPATRKVGSRLFDQRVLVADLNGDRVPDVVRVGDEAGVAVLVSSADGSYDDWQLHRLGAPATAVALARCDDDRLLDLVVACPAEQVAFVLLGQGDGRFGDPVEMQAATAGWCLEVVPAPYPEPDHVQVLDPHSGEGFRLF